MRIAEWLTKRTIAGCVALLLAAPSIKAAAAPLQQAVPAPPGQSAIAAGEPENNSNRGSGKPEADAGPPEAALPDAPEPAQSPSRNQGGQSDSSQPSPDQQQNGAAKPVGTAAAPYEMPTGVAGSRPAGAAIAPAKQRRVRAIVIGVGVILAAGVALGTVAAVSHTSPSQPRQ